LCSVDITGQSLAVNELFELLVIMRPEIVLAKMVTQVGIPIPNSYKIFVDIPRAYHTVFELPALSAVVKQMGSISRHWVTPPNEGSIEV
jgi:hypothetical protein